jgi:hypothetical protein
LKLKKDPLLVEESVKQKLDRIQNRPRLAKDVKLSDVMEPESCFPNKFRWMDANFFDTNFSGISITL